MDSRYPDMRRLKDALRSPALRVIAYFITLAVVQGDAGPRFYLDFGFLF